MAKQIITPLMVVILLTTLQQVQAEENPVICPSVDHSKYCQGYHDFKKHGEHEHIEAWATVPCDVKGHASHCFKTCSIGDHSAYCLGWNDSKGTVREDGDNPCEIGNHTRYCIGYIDGNGQAFLDNPKIFNPSCPAGHTADYCKGYPDGYRDMINEAVYEAN